MHTVYNLYNTRIQRATVPCKLEGHYYCFERNTKRDNDRQTKDRYYNDIYNFFNVLGEVT